MAKSNFQHMVFDLKHLLKGLPIHKPFENEIEVNIFLRKLRKLVEDYDLIADLEVHEEKNLCN